MIRLSSTYLPSEHFANIGKTMFKSMKKAKRQLRLQRIQCWFFTRKWNKENQNWTECRHKRKALRKEINRHFPLVAFHNMTKGL